MINFVSVLLLLTGSWIPSVPASCDVSIKTIATTQPLFLMPGTSSFFPFNDDGHMKLSIGQGVELYCPSTYNNPPGKSGSQYATCSSGTTFTIGGATYDLNKVNCTHWASPITRNTNVLCSGGKVVESGFAVGSRFVKQLEICFNETYEVTRYVKHTLQPGSEYYQSNVPRPSFKTDGFFHGRNVDHLYTRTSIAGAFQRQLGSATANYDLYLARGHLAAMVDFVYGTQQRGTFLFLNAAPQWQSINNGNWKKMEDNIREWVSRNKKHVDCYTGVFSIATLPNNRGVQKPLYLDYDTKGNGFIPVPLLFFRVVIEPSTKRGVVLITINNPKYLYNHIVCPDVSNQINWLTWRKTIIKEGYSYACEVTEFAKKNPYLPRFDVRSLLL